MSTASAILGTLCWIAILAAAAWLNFGRWRLREEGRVARRAERASKRRK